MRIRGFRAALVLPIWLALAASGCRSAAVKGPPDRLLAEGKRLYEAEKFSDARRYFNGVRRYHKESDEAEEALFLQAESERRLHRGQGAFKLYKEFAERYPRSPYSVGAAAGEFRLGVDHFEGRIPGFLFFKAYEKLGVTILEHMQLHYRNHSLADDALARAAAFLLEKRDYESSTDLLRRLLSEYPRSDHMLWARFQLARSLWLLNEGADYDERLLLQARRAFEDYTGTAKLLGQAEAQAGLIAEAERMIARIDERLAERNYRTGRFYERTGRPQSAVYYYRYCVRIYPGTEHAEACRRRLAKLGAAG